MGDTRTTPRAPAYAVLRDARDHLLRLRADRDAAVESFSWPSLEEFNFALDWFDTIADGNDNVALWLLEPDGAEVKLSFEDLAERSNQVANWLRGLGVKRGDRLVLMLGNEVELWECMLAACKLGAVVIPATTLLAPADMRDRVERGDAKHVIVASAQIDDLGDSIGDCTRIAVGAPREGWAPYAESHDEPTTFDPEGSTSADDPMLLYFTSGTTSSSKLVEHTHTSYPVGHLSTMYWLGLQPGDVHLNISSPGWAKHAWSNVFAPWLAEATVLVYNYARFDAAALLQAMERCAVTTFCSPPTVWRMLIQGDLSQRQTVLREVCGAGEPLNAEIIERIRAAWDLTIRDGFGQTETTAQVGNPPGQPLRPGSMGKPLPGYRVVLVDPATGEPGDEGEICLDLSERPLGLMVGYRDDEERNAEAMRDGYYHTGDIAARDEDGYITYVGRTDDVFKAADYRISPFEVESVLIEHEAVVEVAVVPSPDPVRLAVPKAFVTLAQGWDDDRETALAVMRYAREHLASYKRIRRLEFAELPKTISGKIRRVELRRRELDAHGEDGERSPREWTEQQFPELRA